MSTEISTYSKQALENIKDCDFLPEADWTKLSEMSVELQENFEKRQMWRTETEMRISVLNDVKFPTSASKYWQAVREQGVFFENLVMLSFDYRRNNVEIKKLQKKIEAEKDELEKESLNIDLEEAMFKKKNMEVASKDRMRELKLWSKIKKELDKGQFDTKNVNSHQLVSYTQRFINEMLVMGQNGSPSERRNLSGQVQTAIKKCQEKGIIEQVLAPFPEIVKTGIRKDFNLPQSPML